MDRSLLQWQAQLKKIKEWDEWARISCLVSAQLQASLTCDTLNHCDLIRGACRDCQAVLLSDVLRTEGQFPSPSHGFDCLDCSEDECACHLLINCQSSLYFCNNALQWLLQMNLNGYIILHLKHGL